MMVTRSSTPAWLLRSRERFLVYTGTERDVIHPNGIVTFRGTCTFSGTLAGVSGTTQLHYRGTASATSVQGTFRAENGSGGLDDLEAQGTFTATTYQVGFQFED